MTNDIWLRFVLYGLGGWCGEIVWTAIRDRVRRRVHDWKLKGTTYLWMFPIYGSIVFFYEPVHTGIRPWPWVFRGLIYVLGFFAIEYLAGWLLKRLTGSCPWDYSKWSRFSIKSYIRLDYAPIWFLVGLGLEPIHDFLVKLAPLITAAFA
jgi:uncharacterized membrane protein